MNIYRLQDVVAKSSSPREHSYGCTVEFENNVVEDAVSGMPSEQQALEDFACWYKYNESSLRCPVRVVYVTRTEIVGKIMGEQE